MIKSDFSQSMPENPGAVHFVGIGGAGMSGIAHLFLAAGLTVTGSDIRDTAAVEGAARRGRCRRHRARRRQLVGADTLVVTGAIAEDNPSTCCASAGIPVLHRAQALAWLTRGHRLVAVAGAHGKTTSTAMIVTALRALGQDPSFVNGGVIRSLGAQRGSGTG